MVLTTILSGLFGVIGSGVKGFFGVKEAQMDTINRGIKALSDSNTSAEAKERAIADVVSAEANSGYWLAAVWRPLIMVFFAILIGLYFFGYAPDNLLIPVPMDSALGQIFELLQVGLMGYIPARSLEKIVSTINAGSVIKKLIDKNLKK